MELVPHWQLRTKKDLGNKYPELSSHCLKLTKSQTVRKLTQHLRAQSRVENGPGVRGRRRHAVHISYANCYKQALFFSNSLPPPYLFSLLKHDLIPYFSVEIRGVSLILFSLVSNCCVTSFPKQRDAAPFQEKNLCP